MSRITPHEGTGCKSPCEVQALSAQFPSTNPAVLADAALVRPLIPVARLRHVFPIALLTLLTAWAGFGQSAKRYEFDAVSIKPNTATLGPAFMRNSPATLSITNVSPERLIAEAYKLQTWQISGGPNWIGSARYDIEAKAAASLDGSLWRPMLESLLEDRFRLKVHREVKELAIFELVADRNGIKLPPAREGGCLASDPVVQPVPPAPGQPGRCGRIQLIRSLGAQARLEGGKISMPQLAMTLSGILGRTVADQTAFAGTFDINLEFAIDDAIPAFQDPSGKPDQHIASVDAPPSLFTALKEQLGVRLESAKGPVTILVIDQIEKPSSN